MEPFPAVVGIHYSDELRKYQYKEERWVVSWTINLGADHVKLMDKLPTHGIQARRDGEGLEVSTKETA